MSNEVSRTTPHGARPIDAEWHHSINRQGAGAVQYSHSIGAAGEPMYLPAGAGGGLNNGGGSSDRTPSSGDWWSERGAFIELNKKLDRIERKLDSLMRALKEQS